ncbi:STE like transcription factor-domain-containing protein [Mycena galopus ATCC 62051]|nr:STE like transcription factor-domain-containing protein [Mycena galopus ATCC 62051]
MATDASSSSSTTPHPSLAYGANNAGGEQTVLSRPLTPQEAERLAYLDRLKFFLATAPSWWDVDEGQGQRQALARDMSAWCAAWRAVSATWQGAGALGPPAVCMARAHHGVRCWCRRALGVRFAALAGGGGWVWQGDGLGGLRFSIIIVLTVPPGLALNHYAHPNSAITSTSHPALNRFLLPTQEYVSCVLWNGLYHITGTDIVRALVFRFEAFSRPVRNMKKFEEGVFLDLRDLKKDADACLEEPKSPFLDLLFKYQCIRTQGKQKVYYWFSVPHDRLFLNALERDLKREKIGLEPTTQITGEPALSFTYDAKQSFYEQFIVNRCVSKPKQPP